jgi:hypothetical protein
MTAESKEGRLQLDWVAELGPLEAKIENGDSFSFDSDTLRIRGRLTDVEAEGELEGFYKPLLKDSLCSVSYSFRGTRLKD